MRLIAVLILAAASLQQAARPTPAALSGVVTDGATGQPVAGAYVEVRRSQGASVAPLRIITDSKGRFVAMGLEPGPGYSMGAGAAGYLQIFYGWKPGMPDAPRSALTFSLADGEWRQDIAIQLWRQGSISGRVVDEHGNPAVGAAVGGYAVELIAGIPRLLAAGPVATTDDRGVYRLVGLEPGQYRVGLLSVQQTLPVGVREVPQERAVGALRTSSTSIGAGSQFSGPVLDGTGTHRSAVTNFLMPPPPVDGRPRAYAQVFFPNVSSVQDAQIITIGYGTDQRGIDFQAHPVPAFTISGRLDGALSGPLLLRLLPAGLEHLGNGSEIATTLSEKNGAFTFLNVPAGTYTLLAQASILDLNKGSAVLGRLPDSPGYPSGREGGGSYRTAPDIGFMQRQGVPASSFARHPLAVSQDIQNLVVPLTPTVSINGRVVFAPGTQRPPPPAVLNAYAFPVDGDPSMGIPDAPVEADGSFVLTGLLAGRYRLQTGSSLSTESIMWQGKDVADEGFDTRRDTTITDVVLTLTNRGVVVKGAVTGVPVNERAVVIAFPASQEGWLNYGLNPRRIRTVTVDVAGTYELPVLPAGEYLIVAVDATRTYAWTDPKFLAAAATKAQRITINWGESRVVGLPFVDVVVR